MKCLDCGAEMEDGIVECINPSFETWYEFTSNEESKKKEIKGFFTRESIKIAGTLKESKAWHCPKCKRVLMWIDSDE